MNAGCEVKCVNVSSDAGHLAGLNYTPRVFIAKLKHINIDMYYVSLLSLTFYTVTTEIIRY